MESAAAAEHVVFVYGAFLPGEPTHALVATARPLGPARTPPSYELIDFGAAPGMIAGGRTAVTGECYAVDRATLAALDVDQGHPILYKRRVITLEDGREAFAYLLDADQARARRRIRSGDWRSRDAPSSATADAGAWRRWAKARATKR